jgi:hypothetical protein
MVGFRLAAFLLDVAEFLRLTKLAGWLGRIFGRTLEFLSAGVVVDLITVIFNYFKASGLVTLATNNPKLVEDSINNIATTVTSFTPLASKLSALTIEQITGITIDKDKLVAAATAKDPRSYKITMGDEFTQVVSEMLNVKAAQQDFLTRTGSAGSFTNLSAYFGTNLDFQLRSLTISTIADIFGFTALRHLEGLHQAINWAFGFGWLSWSVLANAMDVSVNAGIKRYYLALVKPHDLSTTQANKARIRNMINPEVWGQIHDNAGTRNDARDWQFALEFNQPAIGVIRAAYEHNLATSAQIDEQMILHELTPQGAEWQKQEIVHARKWALEERVATERGRHVVHGWEPSDILRTWLTSLGWSTDEVNLAISAHPVERLYHLRDRLSAEHIHAIALNRETEADARIWWSARGWTEEEIEIALKIAELLRKIDKPKTGKHLSLAEIATFVANGIWDPIKGQQYMVNLGYDIEDVNTLLGYSILQHAVNITPRKVRDACETDVHLTSLLTHALTAAEVLDPLSILKQSDYFRLVTCAIGQLQGTTTPPTTPPPVGPPAPTNLTASLQGDGVHLQWQPVPAIVDYVVYRAGIGDATFTPVSVGSTLTTYIDTSTQPHQVYIYAVRSKVAGVESVNSNEVQVVRP